MTKAKRNYGSEGLEEFIDIDEFTALMNADLSEDLMGAFIKQSGYAATYSVKAASARRQCADIDLNVKLIDAKLTKVMREKLTKAERELADEEGRKPEKITVDMVRAEVMLHPEMRKWLQLQIDADEIRAVCNAAHDAFRTRREMLTGIGHLTRESMKTNIQIKSAQEQAQGYRARRAARRGEAAEEADQSIQ
jgi:hypothetical protein